MSGILAMWRPETFPELLGAALVWSVLGIIVLIIGYKLFDLATPRVKFDEQLNKGNMAVAIVIAALLLGVAIVVHAAIS